MSRGNELSVSKLHELTLHKVVSQSAEPLQLLRTAVQHGHHRNTADHDAAAAAAAAGRRRALPRPVWSSESSDDESDESVASLNVTTIVF